MQASGFVRALAGARRSAEIGDIASVLQRADRPVAPGLALNVEVGPYEGIIVCPFLLGGARRAVAIVNGTLAAAIGLGLRVSIAGAAIWLVGHLAAVWAAKRDPAFVEVVRRHLRYPQHMVA